MFWKKLKYKDIVIASVFIIIISTVGIKVIENFPYFFAIIKKVLNLLTPFAYGMIIAYILNPLVNLFQKKAKLKSGVSIMLTYAVLISIVSLTGVFFIPSIIESALDITKSVPNYIIEMQSWFYEFLSKEEIKGFVASTGTVENINTIITQFGTMIVSILEGSVTHIFSLTSQVVKFMVGILISIYVLIDKERFIHSSKRITFIIFKPKLAENIIEGIRIYHKMICAYIGIKAIDSAIIGTMAFILLEIVNSEYAILLAVIVGITNMIPYFGPFIGEIIGLLFNVFVSPIKGLTVFLVLLGLQFFDGWYLDPKLVGDKVGVRPFFIILAVVIGGGFYGAIGMLLAAPTIATIKIYFDRMIDKNKELITLADKL